MIDSLGAALAWPVELTGLRYALMAAMILIGACLQGVGGLGYAMFCAPLGALFFPELVPAPVLILGCPLSAMAMMRERQHIDWPTAAYSLVGRALGAALAAFALELMAPRTLTIFFAVLILAAVGLTLAGWHVKPSATSNLAAGTASGPMGTITSAGGPPLAIAMHNLAPAQMRATLGCIFLLGSLISLASLASVGRTHWHDLVLALMLSPWMAVGFAVSGPIAQRMSRRAIRNFLLTLAAFGAVGLLVQTFVRA